MKLYGPERDEEEEQFMIVHIEEHRDLYKSPSMVGIVK